MNPKEVVLNGLQARLRRRVFAGRGTSVAALLDEARACLATNNLSEVALLHVRPAAAKAVFRCSHPDFGPCVAKVVSASGSRRKAAAFTEAVRFAQALEIGLFPRIFAVGSNHTVEEYVAGTPLGAARAADFERLDFRTFFEHLRAASGPADEKVPLTPREVEEIATRILQKMLRPPRELPYRKQWSLLRSVERGWGAIEPAWDALVETAVRTRIPRTLAVEDLGTWNVIVRPGRSLVVVDFDFVRSGHWLFDVCWFLGSLLRTECPPEIVRAAWLQICDDTFLGFAGGGTLADSLLRLLFALRTVRGEVAAPGFTPPNPDDRPGGDGPTVTGED